MTKSKRIRGEQPKTVARRSAAAARDGRVRRGARLALAWARTRAAGAHALERRPRHDDGQAKGAANLRHVESG